MKITSWKPKVGGILLSVGSYMMTMSTPWWAWKVGNIAQIVGGMLLGGTARENGVPSSSVPAAAQKDAENLAKA